MSSLIVPDWSCSRLIPSTILSLLSDIKVFLPFRVDKQTHETYTTYLDTTGRPSIVLEKTNCSEKHSQLIYVNMGYLILIDCSSNTDFLHISLLRFRFDTVFRLQVICANRSRCPQSSWHSLFLPAR